MLEVGCVGTYASDTGLNDAETPSHFYVWVIVSSPLTLVHGFDQQHHHGHGVAGHHQP